MRLMSLFVDSRVSRVVIYVSVSIFDDGEEEQAYLEALTGFEVLRPDRDCSPNIEPRPILYQCSDTL